MNSRLIRRSAALGATVGLLLIGTAGASPGFNAATPDAAPPWLDSANPVQSRGDSPLARMNVREKVGQMVQINTNFPLTPPRMQQALITHGARPPLSGGGDVP